MKLSSAMQPLGDIRYGFRAAWKPTLLALWQNPALLLSPAGVSRLFMAHLWTAFATPIDEGNRDLKRSVITANAYGVVLDLGAGYGHTAKHLDHAKVTKYIALEPNTLMHPEIYKTAEAAGFTEADGSLLVLGCGAEETAAILAALGEPHSIDTIVSVLTLCSIPRPEETLTALVREHLKPGGKLVFIEHVLHDKEAIAWWQRFWTPIWGIFFDGCRLDRPTHLWIERMGVWAHGDIWGREEEEDGLFMHRMGNFVKG